LNTIDCELAVIGAGMAGMAAALYAAKRGLEVVQIGRPLGFTYASGLLDLMAVHPVAEGKTWEDPWACIEALVREIPLHPYAKVAKDDIQSALTELDSFLKAAGICYRNKDGLNAKLVTAAGTIKETFKIPQTMWPGVEAFENRHPCLVVDFQGLREFSARQIAAVCQNRWPNLRSIQLPFPGNTAGREVITGEVSARTIVRPENLATLARAIRPHIGDAKAVGLPAILGLTEADRVVADLENQLGAAVFEIPTGPPSVPGLRLLGAFSRQLPLRGVRQFLAHNVMAVKPQPTGSFLLEVRSGVADQMIRSQGIILATGRFLGKGLQADHLGIRETLFNLPVFQPQVRNQWHQLEFFDPQGHPANRAGLEVDRSFRPLDAAGRPAFEKLHAAGSILAHQDWMRMKCGAGLSVATAFAAVKAFAASAK
jgi:glycerol-3-phosphate dehydrogenase subunit B